MRYHPSAVTASLVSAGRFRYPTNRQSRMDLEVALLARRQRLGPHRRRRAGRVPDKRSPVGAPGAFGRIAGDERAAEAALGRAPCPADLRAEHLAGPTRQIARDCGAGGDERPQVVRALAEIGGDPGQVREERGRGLHERHAESPHRVEPDLGVPRLLEHLRHAEPDRDPHPVQEAGLVGQRRGYVDDVVGAESEVVDVVVGRAHQRVVAVERAFRLAGSARREQQLSDLIVGEGRGRRRVRTSTELVRTRLGRVSQDQYVLERRQLRPQLAGHRRVVATPEHARNEQHAGAALAQHERQLTLAEDRHQRLAHRTRAQCAQGDRHELEAVRELEGHGLALQHAKPEQR